MIFEDASHHVEKIPIVYVGVRRDTFLDFCSRSECRVYFVTEGVARVRRSSYRYLALLQYGGCFGDEAATLRSTSLLLGVAQPREYSTLLYYCCASAVSAIVPVVGGVELLVDCLKPVPPGIA